LPSAREPLHHRWPMDPPEPLPDLGAAGDRSLLDQLVDGLLVHPQEHGELGDGENLGVGRGGLVRGSGGLAHDHTGSRRTKEASEAAAHAVAPPSTLGMVSRLARSWTSTKLASMLIPIRCAMTKTFESDANR